jgi:peptidoglycan-associated lipoprotein
MMSRVPYAALAGLAVLLTPACTKKVPAAANVPPAPPAVVEQRTETPAATPAPVAQPAPAPAAEPAVTARKVPFSDRIERELADVFFGYDQSNLDAGAVETANANGSSLKEIFAEHPDGKVTLEGHADERGSAEYNVALGDRRAQTVRQHLVNLGVSPDRLAVVSYGKERPQCTEADESCWKRNRRVHAAAQ